MATTARVEATPPTSKPTPSPSDLNDTLDALWIKHLTLLDQYTTAQSQQAKHFSAAFFSLAQANFKSSSRTRYGRDYYDERMKATRRIRINEEKKVVVSKTILSEPGAQKGADFKEDGKGKDDVNIVKDRDQVEGEDEDEDGGEHAADPNHTSDPKTSDKDKESHEKKAQQLLSPPSTPPADTERPSAKDSKYNNADHTTATEDVNEATPTQKDPITMFGLLHPPALRSSQTSFSLAVDEAMETAVNTSKALRENEAEIRRVRKTLKKSGAKVGR